MSGTYEAIDPRLEHDAEAERMADLANIDPNRWRGAGKRLTAAQAEAKKLAHTVTEAETQAQATAFGQAHALYAGLQGRQAKLDASIRELEKKLAQLGDAAHRLQRFNSVSRDPITRDPGSGSYVDIRASKQGDFNALPPAHPRHAITNHDWGKMLEADGLLKQLADLRSTASDLGRQINALESEYPAFKGASHE